MALGDGYRGGEDSWRERLLDLKARGCVSRDSFLGLVLKRVKSAERHWRKLNGILCLAQMIEGVLFKDGVQEDIEQTAA